jgi:hypothetical protein
MCGGAYSTTTDRRTGETVSARDAVLEAGGLGRYSTRMQYRQAEAETRQQEAQMRAAVAAQEARMAQLAQEQSQVQQDQQQRADGLQVQRDAQLTEIGRMRAATGAAGASLQVLARRGGQAPTATVTRQARKGTSRSAPASSLRIGSGASAAGVGVNIP